MKILLIPNYQILVIKRGIIMKEKNSVFENLFGINVGDHIEKKNGLSYISWPYAWAEIKKKYPDASYEVELFGENKLPYVYDENTGYMVFTSVTINGLTHKMWLPVMDNSNKAMKSKPYTYGSKFKKNITVEAATMFDINKAIMRCLVKNISMFGLGLYIYAGEDLPEIESEKISDSNVKSLKKVIESFENSDKLLKNILKNYGIKDLQELNAAQYSEILQKINDWESAKNTSPK